GVEQNPSDRRRQSRRGRKNKKSGLKHGPKKFIAGWSSPFGLKSIHWIDFLTASPHQATPDFAPGPHRSAHNNAGWSSPVARQAHNLKAAGSNPAPATKNTKQ